MTAAEVLKDCIEDIDNGKWVCHVLHEIDGHKPNPQEMGCAVGLVSLNSGDTVKTKLKKTDLFYDYEEKSEKKEETEIKSGSCKLFPGEHINVGDVIEVARYTDHRSPNSAKEAINYLYEAIPPWKEDEEDWRKCYLGDPTTSLTNKRNAVVSYNDDILGHASNAPQKAKKWFQDALAIAQREGK